MQAGLFRAAVMRQDITLGGFTTHRSYQRGSSLSQSHPLANSRSTMRTLRVVVVSHSAAVAFVSTQHCDLEMCPCGCLPTPFGKDKIACGNGGISIG